MGRFQYSEHAAMPGASLARATQMWLPEIGLYHYSEHAFVPGARGARAARAYSPSLGLAACGPAPQALAPALMQTDPIGYGDGINWYDYVGGDPVNFVDPSGMDASANYRRPKGDRKGDRQTTGSRLPGGCASCIGYSLGGHWQRTGYPNTGGPDDIASIAKEVWVGGAFSVGTELSISPPRIGLGGSGGDPAIADRAGDQKEDERKAKECRKANRAIQGGEFLMLGSGVAETVEAERGNRGLKPRFSNAARSFLRLLFVMGAMSWSAGQITSIVEGCES